MSTPFKHYLGTHSNAIAKDSDEHTKEVKWHEVAPLGKMDLVVDLNFRMDSSALYSDIVLPAASWYEKADLNSTDLHSFIHPPVGRGRAGLGIEDGLGHLQGTGARNERTAAKKYLPERSRSTSSRRRCRTIRRTRSPSRA